MDLVYFASSGRQVFLNSLFRSNKSQCLLLSLLSLFDLYHRAKENDSSQHNEKRARPRLFCGTGWRWQLGNMPTSGLQVCASTAAAWHFDEVVPTCTYVRVPTPASRYRMPRELVLMSLVVESRDSRRLSLTWR